MSFAAPILLLLLIPWLGIALWVLWGRHERTNVPFIELWRGSAEPPKAKRHFEFPLAVIALLVAALLGIVASAQPGVMTTGNQSTSKLTVLFDRGLTMSARLKRDNVLEQAAAEVGRFEHFDVIAMPDYSGAGEGDWKSVLAGLAPVAKDTSAEVDWGIKFALARNDATVLVLTDHPVPRDRRVIRASPAAALENVGIVQMSAALQPGPQVMVTVRNDSDLLSASLEVRSGDQSKRQAVTLPARGSQKSYFIDLPAIGEKVEASLDVADDISQDNIATLTRRQSPPRVEIRSDVPPEVRRVVDAYQSARIPDDGSRIVAIGSDADAAVVISTGAASLARQSPDQVAAHAITANLDFRSMKIATAGAPPGDGWKPIVSIAGHPAVAARESPARQVWIGSDAGEEFARTPAFVILWTNVLDWVGGGGRGSYVSGVTSLPIDPVWKSDWRPRLASLKTGQRSRLELMPALALGAIFCVLVAAIAWPGCGSSRRLTAFSAPRTV